MCWDISHIWTCAQVEKSPCYMMSIRHEGRGNKGLFSCWHDVKKYGSTNTAFVGLQFKWVDRIITVSLHIQMLEMWGRTHFYAIIMVQSRD